VTISSDEVYKPRKARSRRTTFRTRKLVRVATALHVQTETFAQHLRLRLIGCLYDLANVQQTSSKYIRNTRANAGRLLDNVTVNIP